ncbi:unnamed protein product [Heligmosomoides polygyrus]|uniref:ubiquitinyl hydrolase 1 n=1 Tax=Heligmosomoides polygyrus TaxID=6339 RepID=A0A183FQK5_HELPZ|nr:unnamed protein product [Heligmosomoides polygyrus]
MKMSSWECCARLHATFLSRLGGDDLVDGEISEDQDVIKTEDNDLTISSSADAMVSFIFTQPALTNVVNEIYSGKVVKFLIGFQYRGEKDLLVTHTFRYPMDFNYYLQNLTLGLYNRCVAPKEEVTLDYAFFAYESCALHSRRNLSYRKWKTMENGCDKHKGRSSNSGHYVMLGRLEDDKWVMCDDVHVNAVTSDQVLKLSGGGDWHCVYVLLYGPRVIKEYPELK